jgi:hypothetical protein
MQAKWSLNGFAAIISAHDPKKPIISVVRLPELDYPTSWSDGILTPTGGVPRYHFLANYPFLLSWTNYDYSFRIW